MGIPPSTTILEQGTLEHYDEEDDDNPEYSGAL